MTGERLPLAVEVGRAAESFKMLEMLIVGRTAVGEGALIGGEADSPARGADAWA